jgi:hypothetical protein
MFVLLGAVLILLLWASGGLSRFNRSSRAMGGYAALIVAGFLITRGEIALALLLGGLAAWLLGWLPRWLPTFGGRMREGYGRVSHVRTAFLDIELDPGRGPLRGSILAGRYQGLALDALDVPTLAGLCGEVDGDSRALLAAYLDRRDPRWREYAQGDAAAGRARAASGGKMTEQEAYQILGIQAGAGLPEISRAHRSLMKKLHPDQGGSTYLAARVNEAKDLLLRRHR